MHPAAHLPHARACVEGVCVWSEVNKQAQRDGGMDGPDTRRVSHDRNAQKSNCIYAAAGFQRHRGPQVEPINMENVKELRH